MRHPSCPAGAAAFFYLAALSVPDGWRPSVLGFCAGFVLLAWVRGIETTHLFLLLVAVGGGFWNGHTADQAQRIPWEIRSDGTDAVEREVEGVVLEAPRADRKGRRIFRVDVGGAVLRLTVAPSPSAPTSRIDELRAGDRIRAWCRLGRRGPFPPWRERQRRRQLAASGVDAAGRVKSARLVERIHPGSPSTRRLIDQLSLILAQRLDRAVQGRTAHAALAQAILLGRRQTTRPDTLRHLRDAGLVHLVAISGLHVGILFGVGCWLVRRIWRAPSSWLILLPVLVLFAQLVGSRPSVVRACAAAGVLLLGRALGRDGDPLNTLALLAISLATWEPQLVRDAGYQLTFVATAALLGATPRLEPWLPLPAVLARGAAASLAAYLGTVPIIAWQFGRLAPIGLLSNLVALPLCALVLGAGYASMLCRGVPVLHELAVGGLVLGLDALMGLSRGLSELPLGSFPVPRPAAPFLAGYYLSGWLLWLRLPTERRYRRVLVTSFCALLVWLHIGAPPPKIAGGSRAAVIDVGQGQAVALQGGAGGCLLIDAGGSADPRYEPGERKVVPFVRDWGCRRVEVLILSHQDVDHAGGAAAVLRELEVGELWVGPGWFTSSRLRDLVEQAQAGGASVRLVERGVSGRPAGVALQVLAPHREQLGQDDNDRSIVVVAGQKPARIVVPGDLERVGEQSLMATEQKLEAEALVLAHHGSRGSNGAAILGRVRPRLALVSSGPGNRFGHPHEEVLDRVDAIDAELFRTDLGGTLILQATPDGWRVRSQWPQ